MQEMEEMQVQFLGLEDPLGWGAWQLIPVFFPEESHGHRSLWWATCYRVTKSQTQLKRLSMNVHNKKFSSLCIYRHFSGPYDAFYMKKALFNISPLGGTKKFKCLHK